MQQALDLSIKVLSKTLDTNKLTADKGQRCAHISICSFPKYLVPYFDWCNVRECNSESYSNVLNS